MSLWAIVPVKPLKRGKSRLADVLSIEQRIKLNELMLVRTVKTLLQVKDVDRVMVVSRDSVTLKVARDAGAKTLLEDGSPELNVALTRATMIAQAYNVHGVLVVPADLPQLNPEDLQAFAVLGRAEKTVVIAPDHHCNGTNALLMSPPGLIDFDYGENSYERHSERARAAGANLQVCDIPSFSLDIDWPDDLQHLSEEIRAEIGVEYPV